MIYSHAKQWWGCVKLFDFCRGGGGKRGAEEKRREEEEEEVEKRQKGERAISESRSMRRPYERARWRCPIRRAASRIGP